MDKISSSKVIKHFRAIAVFISKSLRIKNRMIEQSKTKPYPAFKSSSLLTIQLFNIRFVGLSFENHFIMFMIYLLICLSQYEDEQMLKTQQIPPKLSN